MGQSPARCLGLSGTQQVTNVVPPYRAKLYQYRLTRVHDRYVQNPMGSIKQETCFWAPPCVGCLVQPWLLYPYLPYPLKLFSQADEAVDNDIESSDTITEAMVSMIFRGAGWIVWIFGREINGEF